MLDLTIQGPSVLPKTSTWTIYDKKLIRWPKVRFWPNQRDQNCILLYYFRQNCKMVHVVGKFMCFWSKTKCWCTTGPILDTLCGFGPYGWHFCVFLVRTQPEMTNMPFDNSFSPLSLPSSPVFITVSLWSSSLRLSSLHSETVGLGEAWIQFHPKTTINRESQTEYLPFKT